MCYVCAYQAGEIDAAAFDLMLEKSGTGLNAASRTFVADDGGEGIVALDDFPATVGGNPLAGSGDAAILAAASVPIPAIPTKPVTSVAPESGNEFVDAFINNGRHYDPNYGDTVAIPFFFDKLDGTVGADGRGIGYDWRPFEKQQFRDALTNWENVINVDFVEVFTRADALFRERLEDQVTAGGTVSASHSLPSASTTAQSLGTYNFEAVNIRQWTPDTLEPGGNFYRTFIHELGHGLGLKHPHDSGSGAFQPNYFPGISATDTSAERQRSLGVLELNHMFGSVMSYIHGYEFDEEGRVELVPTRQRPVAEDYFLDHGFAATPMAYDIAATQYLYGANMGFRTGDNVYLLPDSNDPAPFVRGAPNEAGVPESIVYQEGTAFWECIWDAGGIDELRYDGAASAILDLTAATLDYSETGYGVLSYAAFIGGGYTIANGVVIENATGGSGDDEITGNAAANRLYGRGGEDLIRGGGGNDVLDGGADTDTTIGGLGDDIHVVDDGSDAALEGAGEGYDTLIVLGSSYVSSGNFEVILGVGTAQVLTGDGGDNLIAGYGGADRLTGGGGRDVFVFNGTDAAGAATITDFASGQDAVQLLGWGVDSAAEALAALTQQGADAVLELGGGTSVRLLGTAAAQLTAADFLFA